MNFRRWQMEIGRKVRELEKSGKSHKEAVKIVTDELLSKKKN